MTAFLKIDQCQTCHRSIPWEWVPAVLLNGKALAGTGVWRSQLSDRLCPACVAVAQGRKQNEERTLAKRKELIKLLGGDKPYREFTLENYTVTPGNRLAYERCRQFSPASENLFLWGACGVGKTHLAYATSRVCFDETLSIAIQSVGQLSRKVRMKDPGEEQTAIDAFVQADVLVLEDLGGGNNSDYSRQTLQEVLDGRDFNDRAGLIITSRFSLDALAEKMNDDSIASRVAGMCSIVRIRGMDRRLHQCKPAYILDESSITPPQQ